MDFGDFGGYLGVMVDIWFTGLRINNGLININGIRKMVKL